MEKITVKPSRKGLVIPNPENQCKPYKEEGEPVLKTRYVVRRIKDGDLTQIKTTSKSKKS